MKKYLSLFLILFALCLPIFADEGETLKCTDAKCPGPSYELAMSPVFLGGGGAAATAKFPCQDATHLGDGTAVYKCEDFEGAASCESGSADSNCRNTWVALDACATAVDYSSTAAPLAGTNSALFAESATAGLCTKTIAFTGDSAYVYARVKINTLSIDSYSSAPIAIRTDTTSVCGFLVKNTWGGTTFGVWAGEDIPCSSGCLTPTQGQEYYVWLEYVKGTSCTVYVSETATKPANAQATDTTGIADTSANIVKLLSYDSTNDSIDDVLFDNIAVSATQLSTLE